jgi:predicted lipoprotein with Yx(FWY)xxD motif
MKSNVLLIIGIVVALVVGFGIGLFAGPYILFMGHGHFHPGGFQNGSTGNPANVVHLQYAVNIATKPGIGQYLVNSTGWALYMYVPDTPNSGKSTCYGQCAIAWPIFYTSNLTVEPGINASLFGIINRTDGTKELTFNGYPLYYYEYDTGAGNINGQNVGKIWFVMSPNGTIIYNTT